MKRKIIVSILIIVILITLIVLGNSNRKVYTEIDGVKYAILVNGQTELSFPSGNYKATVSCTNATGYWNQVEQKMIVKDITGDPTCDISFTSITNDDYLNNYIMHLCNSTGTMTTCSGTSASNQGYGELVYENGIRYEGKSPNNYVLFNNELWRIIGIFDSSSHGQTGKNLVKIIRNGTLGCIVWDKAEKNNWPNSSLKALLNESYYNHTIDILNCYQADTSIKSSCNYTVRGIQNPYQGLIENVIWYLGGGGKDGYTTYTPDSIYSYERDANAIYSGNSATSTGKIGLMYSSDYAYSILASDCARSIEINAYSGTCLGNSWLYAFGDEYTITHDSANSNNLWDVREGSSIAFGYSTAACFDVRPVVYLLESTYRVSGTGTISDPYIIGMAASN